MSKHNKNIDETTSEFIEEVKEAIEEVKVEEKPVVKPKKCGTVTL